MVHTSGLATRCTACGTIFRVVPDQLRVSEGWVRCGRCTEVFNAAENLVDLDSGAPLRTADPTAASVLRRSPAPAPGPVVPRPSSFNDEADTQPWGPNPYEAAAEAALRGTAASPRPADRGSGLAIGPAQADVDLPLDVAPPSSFTPEPASRAAGDVRTGRRLPDAVDSRYDARLDPSLSDHGPADTASAALLDPPFDSQLDEWQGPRPQPQQAAAPDEVQPSFLRKAERAERWRQPRVRASLAVLGLLSLVVLTAQVTLVYRDLAAARWPVMRPWLEQGCQVLGCTVEAARVIQSLTVDSSGLVRVERSNVYRLQVALRNHAGIAVALPALDLSLTDTQGRLIARRVLQARDLQPSAPGTGVQDGTADLSSDVAPVMAPGQTLALQATLQSLGEPIAGYTIELFYP